MLAGDPAFRCERIDGARQLLFQFGEDAISRYAGTLRQRVECVGPDGLLEIFRRDGTVRTCSYPGLRNLTLAGLLNFLTSSPRPPLKTLPAPPPAIIFSNPDNQSDPSPPG